MSEECGFLNIEVKEVKDQNCITGIYRGRECIIESTYIPNLLSNIDFPSTNPERLIGAHDFYVHKFPEDLQGKRITARVLPKSIFEKYFAPPLATVKLEGDKTFKAYELIHE